ncbi:hypothetical protein [Streptomyces sp. NBC_00258]|uniref:hypothetical protein n=1 Tax=Streptomyces sp. NBC_00258 TaxID=2903642 RepID=UPI002E2A6090|nr:hypothetical protein [Streptomyces sp. NBC_00258]
MARFRERLVAWWRSHSVKRRALGLTAVAVVVTLAMLLIRPYFGASDEPSSGNTPTKTPTDTSKIENLGFTVAVSDKSYRAILPLRNPQKKEQFIDEVELIVTFGGPACAEIPQILVYDIQSAITVDPSGKIKQGSVSAESGLAKGFTTPASGELNWGCGIDQLQLRFRPPGAILAQQSTTPIQIDVPRKLTVTKMINGTDGFDMETAELPSISSPYSSYVAFHAISTTKSGDRTSSCFLLAASDHKPGTGPQGCDTKIGQTPVFWRQKYGPNQSWLKYEKVS